MPKINIHSWLLRCSTARGSGSGLFLGGPTKVKTRWSFLFTEGSLKVENQEIHEIVNLINSTTTTTTTT